MYASSCISPFLYQIKNFTEVFFFPLSPDFQLSDVVENEAKMAYMRPPSGNVAAPDEQRNQSKGFVVREAPWAATNEKVSLANMLTLKCGSLAATLLNPPPPPVCSFFLF